jgi:hypothetical protein
MQLSCVLLIDLLTNDDMTCLSTSVRRNRCPIVLPLLVPKKTVAGNTGGLTANTERLRPS